MTNFISEQDYINQHLPRRLMEAGIGARPNIPLAAVPESPKPEMNVWVLVISTPTWGSRVRIPFLSEEDAMAANKLIKVYYSDFDDKVICEVTTEVQSKHVFTQDEYNRVKIQDETAKAVRESNKNIQAELDFYDGQVNQVCRALSAEWEEIESERLLRKRINTTFAEYCALTDDDRYLAFKFLLKAFPAYEASYLAEIVNSPELAASPEPDDE